jgi:hypothetical protein
LLCSAAFQLPQKSKNHKPMCKKYPLLMLLLVCLPWLSKAQYTTPANRVWALGYEVGVDFTNGSPVPITTALHSFEGSASVCDSTGQLLMYTDGNNIWRGNGALMPNGFIINGGAINTTSTTQGAVIVPDPGNYNRYYVFSLASNPISKLYCNVVDFTLASGAGAVDTSFYLKGVMIADSLSEKMVAINACDNNVWLLTHAKYRNEFYAFLITPFGINTNPVVSTISTGIDSQYNFQVMKVSPDQTKLMCSGSSRMEMYSFSAFTGQVFNPVVVTDSGVPYGGAFSPDGTKYYAGGHQYDLSVGTPPFPATTLNNYITSDMRLGPDGKIYFKSPLEEINTFLGRINNPNIAGSGCGYEHLVSTLAFPLNGLTYGFPQAVVTVPQGYIPPSTLRFDTVLCSFPPGGIDLDAGSPFCLWDDGSNQQVRNITQPGVYHVIYQGGACRSQIDSFIIRGTLPDLVLVYNAPVLSATASFPNYMWYKDGVPIPGASNATQIANGNGWYSLVVTNEYGCRDSASIEVTGFSGIYDPESVKALIKVYPQPATDRINVQAPFPVSLRLYSLEGRRLVHLPMAHEVDINAYSKGFYLLHIYDKDGRLLRSEKIVKQ